MGWAEAALKFRPYPEQLDRLKRAEQIARDLNDNARLARALYWTGRVHIPQGHAFHSIASLAIFGRGPVRELGAREIGDGRILRRAG